MMMAWKNYSTINRIRVADVVEAGDEFVGLGGTLAGGDGRYQIDTADKKSLRILGEHNNHQWHSRCCWWLFLLSPYSN